MVFPSSDRDVAEFVKAKGPHLSKKDPPTVPEADLHVLVLPPERQFSIDESNAARLYAVTTNFSYFPMNVEISFRQIGDVVEFLGETRQLAKVPPVARDGAPGIKARFVNLKGKLRGARGDVGAEWSLPKNGKFMTSELLTEIETA